MVFSPLLVSSQCRDALFPEVMKKIDTHTYIKDFQIKLKEVKTARDKDQITMPIMLSKGNKYRFVLNDAKEFQGRLIFELYSDRGARKLQNYIKEIDKFYDVVEFDCHTSGMYFLNLTFKDKKEGCGVLAYGFTKL